MKAIVFCIIGTLLVICFAHPQRIAEMFNPPNKLTYEQAQDCCRAMTGQYPHGVPVLLVGSFRDDVTLKLEAALQRHNVAFQAIDIMSNANASTVMNKIGKQEVPTTIVGTTVISGFRPEEIEQALMLEQKSLRWQPPNDGKPGHNGQSAKHGGAPGRSVKHGHAHGAAPAR